MISNSSHVTCHSSHFLSRFQIQIWQFVPHLPDLIRLRFSAGSRLQIQEARPVVKDNVTSFGLTHRVAEFGQQCAELVEGKICIVPACRLRRHFIGHLYARAISYAFPQFLTNPIWTPAQIQDGKHLRLFPMLSIINAKWKTARQHPVKFEVQRMNAAETGETPDIDQ